MILIYFCVSSSISSSSHILFEPDRSDSADSKIPLFKGLEGLLNKGLCPSGTERNLKSAAPLTTFSADIGHNHQLLLADAQTSGGILMSVPKASLETLLTDLKKNSFVSSSVIGQVIQTDEPAQIQVES